MMTPGTFEVLASDPLSQARRGRLWTLHGPVNTPVFMPVGTQATVKTMTPRELDEMGVEILLGNTYHLNIRPGVDIIEKCGGLHRFMGWSKPILTDSGGFQVFSLSGLRKIKPDGVEFASHVDGAKLFLGPREAMDIQRRLGSDIMMAFDECTHYPCTYEYACQSITRTLLWEALCAELHPRNGQLLFGIVQGGEYADLRAKCARELTAIGFDGYAVGGVSVGEPEPVMMEAVRNGVAELPVDRPRYLMGVGVMRQLVAAVSLGVDMFDCVMPTRYARHGTAITRAKRYPVKAAEYKVDTRPVEEGCRASCCLNDTRAEVWHMLNANEILGVRLLSVHNLHQMTILMREIRAALDAGVFEDFKKEFLEANKEDR